MQCIMYMILKSGIQFWGTQDPQQLFALIIFMKSEGSILDWCQSELASWLRVHYP